ncbi:Gfo/Idh/MocA family protein [Streptomyces sp. MA5143a]|uniref:Gfo/Idh/MocA family protein n=1 Tax=Streptomyces sp. MA5143a TaxID=2083010 RepID=UPI000D2CF426|nr:Gfo/Idh/MocA family oxidoreductase [Streptomyces sp. MA5143a]SPF06556.1 Glucose-fructose oxidoreductase precursor [Streptomyces sp. MA5143a]
MSGPSGTGPERTVRVGVLGCADIAWRRVLPAITAEPRTRLVAIASRDAAKARRFTERFGGEPVEGYDRLLDRGDLDAVYVPLPTGLHAAWAVRALRSGLHVLVEKPLATSRAEAALMLETARANGVWLMENFMFLHHGQHEEVRRLVAAGEIGELRSFSAAFGIPPLPAGNVRHRADLGGGALLDVGVYPLRAARLLLGGELDPVGAVLRVDPELGVDVAGHVLLTTADGVTAELSFGFEHSYRCSYALWGGGGRIVLDRAFTPPPTLRPVLRLEQQDLVREITLAADDQYGAVVRSFAAAVLDGVPPRDREEDLLGMGDLLDRVRACAREIR